MLKAAGVRGSANWHQVALMNWARMAKVDIGAAGHAGCALFVEPGMAYVVECLGPSFPALRFEFPAPLNERTFNGEPIGRWMWMVRRREAFRKALFVFQKLQSGK